MSGANRTVRRGDELAVFAEAATFAIMSHATIKDEFAELYKDRNLTDLSVVDVVLKNGVWTATVAQGQLRSDGDVFDIPLSHLLALAGGGGGPTWQAALENRVDYLEEARKRGWRE